MSVVHGRKALWPVASPLLVMALFASALVGGEADGRSMGPELPVASERVSDGDLATAQETTTAG